MFASRASPSETKKPSWRFFSSTPAPPIPPLPALRSSHSASPITSTRGHYRTHSTTSSPLHPDGDFSPARGSGATVVRTPSEARRGCMKVRPAPPVPRLPPIQQSAELPMMEECDRRVSLSAAARVALAQPVPSRVIHKSTSMAAIGSKDRDRERSRRSFVPAPLPNRDSDKTHRATFIPPPNARAPPSAPLPFSATLLDITQRPAPSATDQIFLKIDFGFSLDDKSSTSGVTLPLDIVQRGGGYLEKFVQGHLEEMKDRANKAADEERGMRIVSDVPSYGSRPGMTDGESGTDSDLESEEYGSSSLLRDEYLKSLWAPSPTSDSFTEPPAIPAKSPARTSKYYTPPKNRALTRNQYSQQTPFPTPSSPHLPITAPLTIRRRATYLVLPSTEPRGHMIEIKILLQRDAACWHHIAARLVQGSWARMDERRAQGVMVELEWAGMSGLLAELRPVSVPKVVVQPETPPMPALELEWAAKRHRRMSSKSLRGDVSGVKGGGAGYL